MNNDQISWLKLARRCCVAFSFIGFGVPAVAQIVPDATLGAERTRVAPDTIVRGNGTLIEGGAVRGSNLFQSFQEFNVGNGQRVYFANPIGVQTIFSRVTGANASHILGTLGVNGGANLFLLNPNGILFGPNAQLDLRGSFLATTGRVVFADGSTFGASNPQAAPLLTMSAPVGVQYGANATGTIQNRGNLTVGQDLTLTANKLDLQGQLQAGRDLQLQAQNTVQIRDTTAQPFLARSGRNLTIQGNQSVDILALNHPSSGFFSGGDLILRSDSTIGGDAHFQSGGSFRIEQLDGTAGNLFSPHDPVILADGDVTLGNYSGASLHVLAGGSITLGAVNITGAGTASNTINAGNPDPFLASLATVPISNGDEITIDGRNPTLDLRAGVDWGQFPNFPGNTGIGIAAPSATPATSANITVGSITNAGGVVLLTNQYNPDAALSRGTIQITSSLTTKNGSGDGGNVYIDSSRDIQAASFISSASTAKDRTGGDILLLADGAISVSGGTMRNERFALGSFTDIAKGIGNAGNAGNITVQARGDITIGADPITRDDTPNNIYSFGAINASVTTRTAQADAGNSGNVQLTSTNGKINVVGGIFTNSTAEGGGDAGTSGRISLLAPTGEVKVSPNPAGTLVTRTRSVVNNQPSPTGMTGDAGSIDINARSITLQGRPAVDDLDVTTESTKTGLSGNISLTSQTPLTLTNLQIGTDARDGGSGDITIDAPSLTLDRTKLSTTTQGAGQAGNIQINATNGLVLLNQGTISSKVQSTDAEDAAGDIAVTAASIQLVNNSTIATDSKSDKSSPGTVNLQARDRVEITNSKVTSDSKNNEGDFGIVQIQATEGSVLLNQATLTTKNNGAAGAADIYLGARARIEIANSTISDDGYFGRIFIGAVPEDKSLTPQPVVTPQTIVIDSSGLTATNETIQGTQDAGMIVISATGNTFVRNSTLSGTTTGTGRGGSIDIDTDSLLLEQSNLDVETLGSGAAGSINIKAHDQVALTGGRISNSLGAGATVAPGQRGSITLAASKLSLTQGGTISSSINQADGATGRSAAQGDAGTIDLQITGSTFLSGTDSRIRTVIESGAQGTGGSITLNTGSLTVDNNAFITASTLAGGIGNAGQVIIAAQNNVLLQQNGRIASGVRVNAKGNAGTIQLTAGSLNLTSGGTIETSVATGAQGNAGAVSLTVLGATTLSGDSTAITNAIKQGASGNGGNIFLKTGSLSIADGASIDSTISGASNRAGDIQITAADQINLRNRAGITASNLSKEQGGLAGNITLSARLLKLDTNAFITAETGSGGGGNIQITTSDLLLLRRNSVISTTAGTSASGGNGGNITITAPKGFLVAVPSENSDIIANAFGGKGGTIKIAANRVFGLQTRGSLSSAQLLEIRRNGTSDISASSDVGLNGQISISTLQIDPSQGLAEVPVDLIDPSSLIAQGCQPGNAAIATRRSEFVITGRGGLPPGPSEVQTGSEVSIPWVRQAVPVAQADRSEAAEQPLAEQPLVEAQGIAIAPNGSAFLTAQSTTATPVQSGFAATTCPRQ